MTQIISIFVSKNADIDAEFEFVEKVAKTCIRRSYRAENFCTQYQPTRVLKVEKVHHSYTFKTFFV
jgi:hypothetical protein